MKTCTIEFYEDKIREWLKGILLIEYKEKRKSKLKLEDIKEMVKK